MSSSHSKTPLWKHPVLHFALLGGLIFLWDGIRPQSPSPDSQNIVVTAAQMQRMSALWSQTWGRAPTQTELDGLVQDHIKEEVYYREAKRLGLDLNDTIIKRRLRQKMEFLSADDTEVQKADEAELRKFYKQNLEKYRTSALYDIEQVYYKTLDEPRMKADRAALQQGQEHTRFGDPISLPKALKNADADKITKLYGSGFYERMTKLEGANWQGPIQSGFGFHLVRVTKTKDASTKTFAESRAEVESDWRARAKLRAREQAYQALARDYKIDIEPAIWT